MNHVPHPLCNFPSAAVAAALVLAQCGCQQQMADQPSFKPLQPSEFFDDGQSARSLVPGVVARGHLRTSPAFSLGRTERPDADALSDASTSSLAGTEDTAGGFEDDRAFVEEFPIPVTETVVRYGHHRYMIYCVVCHDPVGTGRGKIVERGYAAPPSYHIERLRNDPVGRLFAVVSEGYGAMPSYSAQIPPEDRWAIVAYVRALQLSQHFPADQLDPEMQEALRAATATGNSRAELLPPKEDLR